MRTAVSLAVWLAFGLACSPPCVRTFPAPASQPIGGPCQDKSECAPGLICQPTPALATAEVPSPTPGSVEVRASSGCTADCSTAGCPTGSACVAGGAALCPFCPPSSDDTSRICLPTCTNDGDCQTSLRAGRCSALDGGPKVCVPMVCIRTRDCPTGFDCDVAGGTCGSGNEMVFPGWCRRR